jgi:TonB family protein
MRHILASTLILSTMLLPAVAKASTSTDDAAASTPNLRVSTGVTAPKLVESINIALPDGLSKVFLPTNAEVGLTLTVDSNGQAQNVKVVKPSNPYWDARVVDAIQKSQFHPGKVDNTPVPVDMNLTVVITR